MSQNERMHTGGETCVSMKSSKKFTGLLSVTLIVVVSILLFAHLPNASDNNDMPDPEFPLPPSGMPAGLYRRVGVVSNGGLCAQIGVDVISRGGNAVDAAIATMLCDGALCPEYMGIGGGFLMSFYNVKTKKVMSIDARETAPAAATKNMFVKNPYKSVFGGLAAAVPGELKGYWTIYNLYSCKKVSWKSLFEPTIRLCEEGIEISDRLHINIKNNEELIKKSPVLRDVFIDKRTGLVLNVGDKYKLPMLAETLKIIAKEGADALYHGSLTSRFIEDLQNAKSIITKEDLANYKVRVDETLMVSLKTGHNIHVGPPPGSGIILAYILRILDGILPAPNAALDAHRMVEAFKFGFGERSHLGDHEFVDPTGIYGKVKSDSYIESIRRKISDNFISLDPKYYGADFDMVDNRGTANMVVIDSQGNVVVGTSTINTYFGCGYMSPSTGIIVNNAMDDFSSPEVVNSYGIPSSPANFIQPGKRPMSSMCPTIITDAKGNFVLGVGAAGGSKITLATAYVSALQIWYHKNLKDAVDKPRFYHQLVPTEIQYEYGMTRDVVQKLKDIGHPMSRLNSSIGSAVTAIAISPLGMIVAMPDFRRSGNSSGY